MRDFYFKWYIDMYDFTTIDFENLKYYFTDDDIRISVVTNKCDTFWITGKDGKPVHYFKSSYRIYFTGEELLGGVTAIYLYPKTSDKIMSIINHIKETHTDLCYHIERRTVPSGYLKEFKNQPYYLAITKDCEGE